MTPPAERQRNHRARLRERTGLPRWEVYPDTSGSYRWRLVGGNGRIVASSGESFDSRSNAERAVQDVIAIVLAGPAVVVEEAGNGHAGT